jgi:hypothetical protein
VKTLAAALAALFVLVFFAAVAPDNLTGAVRLYTKAGMRPDPRLVVRQRPLSSASARNRLFRV